MVIETVLNSSVLMSRLIPSKLDEKFSAILQIFYGIHVFSYLRHSTFMFIFSSFAQTTYTLTLHTRSKKIIKSHLHNL